MPKKFLPHWLTHCRSFISVVLSQLYGILSFSHSYGPFPHLSEFLSFLLTASVSVTLSVTLPPSHGWWIDCVFGSRGEHGVKHMCWGEWLNNQLSFLTAPNELHRSRGQEAISPLLPRLWTQPVPSLSSFSAPLPPSLCSFTIHMIPLHRHRQCLLVHYHKSTNNVTPPFSLNNLSKTIWVTFASECCQSRFPPVSS